MVATCNPIVINEGEPDIDSKTDSDFRKKFLCRSIRDLDKTFESGPRCMHCILYRSTRGLSLSMRLNIAPFNDKIDWST